MNFFKLYVGDYQRDTAHLSITEHGAYMLMLQHYYATEKPLPSGKALHRMLRAQDKAERDAIDAVAAQFWTLTDDGLVNARADREIKKAGTQAETNRQIAVAREEARKAKRAQHEQSTNRATNVEPNHSQTPDTREEPSGSSLVASRRRRLPDDFCPNQAGVDKAHERGLDPGVELQKFSDYHRAKGSVMADWQAAWRTWVGNARRTTEHATLSDAGLRTAAAARAAKVMIFGRDAA